MSYAVPLVNWSPLGNLLDTYNQARDQKTLRGLGALVGPDGSPDYGRMAQALLSTGNVEAGLKLSQLAEGRNAYQGIQPLLTASVAQSAPPAPSAPAAPALPGTSAGIPPGLINSESSGNFRAQNDVQRRDGTRGHFGRLQFSTPRIQEAINAGALPAGTTPQAFMASPELQQRAEQWHFADIDAKIRQNGLDQFVGRSINGVPVTLDGMRAVAHLGGSEGLRRFLLTGGRYNPRDANGTSLMDYLGRHAGQVAQAPAGQPSAAEVVDQMWNNRRQFNYGAAPQAAPADTLSGGDGLDGGDGMEQPVGAVEGFRQRARAALGMNPDGSRPSREAPQPMTGGVNIPLWQGGVDDFRQRARAAMGMNPDGTRAPSAPPEPMFSGVDLTPAFRAMAPNYVFRAAPSSPGNQMDAMGAAGPGASYSARGGVSGIGGSASASATVPNDAAWEERLRLAAEQAALASGQQLWGDRPASPPQMAGLPEEGPMPGGGVAPSAPQYAPVPMARPDNLGAPRSAPVPMARPEQIPPQAQPAMAPQSIIAPPSGGLGPLAGGMSERERLMLLRDEQSLAPGEADSIRQSLPGAAMPARQMSRPAQPQTAPQTPAGGPLGALAQGPATQAPQQAPAPVGAPQQIGPQQSQSVQAPQDLAQRIMIAMANPALPASARQALAAQLQRLQPDLQILARPDGSVWAIDKRNPQNARQIITGTAAPVSWQPIKDEAQNITGFYNPQTMEIRGPNGQPVQRPQSAPQPQGAAPQAAPQPAPQAQAPAAASPAPAAPSAAPQIGPTGLPMNRTAFQRQQDERQEMARRNNIREGSEEYKFLMVNGRLPTAGEKLTEQQSKDLIFHRRGVLALQVLDGPTDPNNPDSPRLSDALSSGFGAVASRVPGGNYVQSEAYQKADQAGRNFLAVILRKDSGAAITDPEMDNYGRIFLPRPGDGEGVLRQKAEARRQAVDAIRAGLGTAEVKAIGEEAIRDSTARSRGQQPGAAIGPGVSRADLEAEARRRGLIQ